MVVKTELAEKIIGHYGYKHQMVKVAEELAELSTLVLQKVNDSEKVPMTHLIEEIADCYVVLTELEVMHNLDSRDIQPIIDWKLDRTIERMKRE